METATIRRAASGDISRLAELWHEKRTLLQQSDHRFGSLPGDSAAWAESAGEWLARDDCAVFVGERDDQIAGYVVGWLQTGPPSLLTQHLGIITELVIDTHTYQGGLGTLLLRSIQDWFKQSGVHNVVAYAPHYHAVEQAFWRALGADQWIDFMWIR
jgi:L-amino acid N-acyltransferase YncA